MNRSNSRVFQVTTMSMLLGGFALLSFQAAGEDISERMKRITERVRKDRARREKEERKRIERFKKEREKALKEKEEKARKAREKYEKELEKVRKNARKLGKKYGESDEEIERRIEESVRDYEAGRRELMVRAAMAMRTLQKMEEQKRRDREKVHWIDWNGRKIPATVFRPNRYGR